MLRLPSPCLKVDLAQGYAVVPDPNKRFHILLVPTRRIVGIEDPALLAPNAPNYWALAWAARLELEKRLGRSLDREEVGLAINAVAGRSQEQFHIHISCIRPDVARALAASAPDITARWSMRKIADGRWRVRRLRGSDLRKADPFKLLGATSADIRAHMGEQTLVLVGARLRGGEGFYLLSRSTRPWDDQPGHGEVLLDETCRSGTLEGAP